MPESTEDNLRIPCYLALIQSGYIKCQSQCHRPPLLEDVKALQGGSGREAGRAGGRLSSLLGSGRPRPGADTAAPPGPLITCRALRFDRAVELPLDARALSA